MKRNFTFLIAALMLLSFLNIPTGMKGQSTITVNYSDTFNPTLPTASSSVNTSSTSHVDETASNFAFAEQGIYKGSSNNYFMFVQNKGFLYNTADLGTITSISVTYSSGTSTQAKAGVYFGSTVQSTYTTTNNNTIAGQSQTDTWTNNTTGYGYFQLSTSNKNCQITKIEITYTSGGSNTPTLTSLTCTGSPAITSYEVGDYFVPTGLTVTANYSDHSTADVTSDVVWTPAPFTSTATTQVTGTYSGQTVTVSSISVTAASDPDIVLNKDHSPFSSTNTSSNTNTETVTLDGIEYENYGGYIYSNYLSFNRNINGYLGNNTVLCGNIKKVVVSFSTATAYSSFTMYEGTTALSETTTVAANPKTSGSTHTATYMFSRNNGYFKFKLTTTGNYCNINSISIYLEDCTNPAITVSTNSLEGFTYIETLGPSAPQSFTVSGDYLTADLSMSLGNNSDFEISQNQNSGYTNTIDLTPLNGVVSSTTIYARLKANKTIGNYSGTITLTSTDATDKTISLSGTVTGQTFTLSDISDANGSITFTPASPVEAGTHVTLTPVVENDAYYFVPNSWTFKNDANEDVTTSITFDETNVINMPAFNLKVNATFDLKPTHSTTCTVTGSGIVTPSPSPAYEGQTVTLTITPETGWNLSTITATYVDGNSATQTLTLSGSGNTRTFTMPNYDVIVEATFLSNTFEGSFVLFTGEMTEGDYILVYGGHAMNNTPNSSNNKLGATEVEAISDVISNPSRDIVWHIAPIGTDGKWTIYNAIVNKYVNASGSGNTNITLVDNAAYSNGAKWSVEVADNTYDFSSLSDSRALRYNNDVFGHYATSNGGPLTLYKYTVLTERTITFNGNGGTYNNATTYTQTVYDGIATNLNNNQFTNASSAFAGWSTTQNGTVEYADGASITVTGSNLTLYAQWATSYTAMVDDAIVGGTVKIVDGTAEGTTIIEAAEGTEITLTHTANSGHAFNAWNVYKDGDPTTTVTVTDNKFSMPAYDVIISATFEEVATYSLVTNVNQIVPGKHYIIVGNKSSTNTYYAMGYDKGNNRNAVEVTVSNNMIVATDGIYEFVLNQNGNNWTIYDKNTPNSNTNSTFGYLYAGGSGSGKNYLKTTDDFNTRGNNFAWSIEITENVATITATGTNTNNLMRFNDSNNPPIFSCYASGQKDIYLYMKDNDNNFDFYKDIEAASNWSTESVGWNFIASPLASDYTPAGNMLANEYDLYQLNNTTWENFKEHTGNNSPGFNLVNGRGYLYANSANVTLHFSGAINTFTTSGNANVKTLTTGWNLIGNPYNIPIYINKPYYKMKADGSGIETSDNITSVAIPACTGVIVNGENETVTFTTTAPVGNSNNHGNVQMTLAQTVTTRGGSTAETLDKAIVSFNEGSQLGKFYFGTQNANLYIPQGNEEYAIVSAEAQGEMPVNFVAHEDGTYTLSINPENVEMDYLHLIDNLTGNDIDLMVQPDYTFSARTTDYTSRFRLVFSANNVNENTADDSFAFIANGNLIVNGEGYLQVFDILGHQLYANQLATPHSSLLTPNFPTGVYVIRLTNGNAVKTQKIVVK